MNYDERELKRSIMKVETLLCDIYDALEIPMKCCPVCESGLRLFTPYGERLRPNAKCPICGALERNRAWWLYYKKIGLLGEHRKVIMLHFAPEKEFYNRFMEDDNIMYYPVDFNPNYPGIIKTVDITNNTYEDESFDIIICNHVLEHIPDENKALSECARVLKKDGVMYLSTPLSGKKETLEKEEYNTDELRSRYYGQHDHVRYYGEDIDIRLNKYFNVQKIDCIKELDLPTEDIKRYGLSSKEYIWRLTKQ